MPKPTLSFLIPSLKDQEKLECRVYIPKRLLQRESPSTPQSRTSTSDDDHGHHSSASAGLSSLDMQGNDRDPSRKKAAIIAHPYAPLGGSFDDNVVQEAAEVLLDHGFIVGTFNFRGAGQSRGHTSWSAKPEVSDYMAFVGFMAVFMTYLDIHPKPFSTPPPPTSFAEHVLATIPSQRTTSSAPLSPTASTLISPRGSTIDINGEAPTYDGEKAPLLLMAGYSYGSLVTQLLPSLPEILSSFTQPPVRTPSSEIRFRAREMADIQNRAHFDRLAHEHDYIARHNIDLGGSGIRIGSEDDNIRKSRDRHHRPSLHLDRLEHHEWARKSVDRMRSIRHSMDALSPTGRSKRHSWVHDDDEGQMPPDTNLSETTNQLFAVTSSGSSRPATSPILKPAQGPAVLSNEDAQMFSDPVIRAKLDTDPAVQAKIHVANGTLLPSLTFDFTPAYLLISPIQGALGGLATMFATTSHTAFLPSIPFFKKDKEHKFSDGELKLVHHQTLAIFGGSDGFSRVEMMRKWTRALHHAPGSLFQAIEINGAGHFWHDHGHLDELKTSIRVWICEIE